MSVIYSVNVDLSHNVSSSSLDMFALLGASVAILVVRINTFHHADLHIAICAFLKLSMLNLKSRRCNTFESQPFNSM